MKTYWQIHAGLHYFNGLASEYPCMSCAKPAAEWAYLHTAGDEEIVDDKGRAYSENFEFYAPMCKPCHRSFDSKKMWADPEAREILSAASTANLTAWRERVAQYPEAAQRMKDGWARGAETRRRRREADEAHRQDITTRWSQAGREAAKRLRRCAECKREMAAGPMGSHQKATGHTGWEEA